MYRSSSSTRLSEEFFTNSSILLTSSPSPKAADVLDSDDQLPIFNSQSSFDKKEKSRIRSAENSVHLIPIMLLLCAVILWLFSGPESKLH